MVRRTATGQDDLFSVAPAVFVRQSLAGMDWPSSSLFPVNHARVRVADVVWADVRDSDEALVLAGFASIAELVELAASRCQDGRVGVLRVLLGTEPFSTQRVSFGSPAAAFTDEVHSYWTEQRGVSLSQSAKIVQVLTGMDDGLLSVRFMPGATRLHAKVYVGDTAATVGSSNFTDPGLRHQFEANARFDRKTERHRYEQTRQVAENYWSAGQAWDQEFRDLLRQLLQFVTWQEALAHACADLLNGDWAQGSVRPDSSASSLWPSQYAGIAEALWIVENVGSVLVADATGSGKTRMGAHLARAVRDRLWSTGRVRSDLTVLVCPPPVEEQWRREAVACGLNMSVVSQGLLSRDRPDGPRVQQEEVNRAQLLAIDEAHGFLTPTSNRTRQVRDSLADHVLLFTATPINRGAQDLLALVSLLGPDNFEDETLDILDQLSRRNNDPILTPDQQALLRREIQRFTVRRTKSTLNDLVAERPESYRHPVTGRICRYPEHVPRIYPTGETSGDNALAEEIREDARSLTGITQLGRVLAVPVQLRHEFTDERWLQLRLGSGAGLASYHVLSALRSSTAALLEHLLGTDEAVARLGITDLDKPQRTGDVFTRLSDLRAGGPPSVELTCAVPGWLTHPDQWRAACDRETATYRAIANAAEGLSGERERTKAALIANLATQHDRVLAFDHHPITLAAISPLIDAQGTRVVIATGSSHANRDLVRRLFSAASTTPAVALCSDAMSEGLNLQGASAIVHFDLPTTLRVAEQRVGRVDRMDSPYDAIEAWWPRDGLSFATRANELLTARNAESSALLGSNLLIPDLRADSNEPVDVAVVAALVDQPRNEAWDGIQDALDPVRKLVFGEDRLIPAHVYEQRDPRVARVLARVSPVRSTSPFAFFAIRSHAHGAPRWLLLEGDGATVVVGLDRIAARLRALLEEDPPSRDFDQPASETLERFLTAATSAEWKLIPRKYQRALEQMAEMTSAWAEQAARASDFDASERWHRLATVTRPDPEVPVDPHRVAEIWWQLVRPLLDQVRGGRRRHRLLSIRDVSPLLRQAPFALADVESALSGLTTVEALDRRVSACILGVPDPISD